MYFPGTLMAQLNLEPSTQDLEAAWQLPAFQRSGEVQGPGFTFQQGEIVDGVVLGMFLVPMSSVLGYQMVVHHQANLINATHDGDLAMGIGRGN